MSASHDLHALSDAIYEAAFIPDSWPALLHAIASLTGTVGGALIATPPTYPKWDASAIAEAPLDDVRAGEGHVRRFF